MRSSKLIKQKNKVRKKNLQIFAVNMCLAFIAFSRILYTSVGLFKLNTRPD